jgi:hypothetical protein
MEHKPITYPTWERYTVLAHVIFNLSIRDRRRIFQIARSVSTDWSNVLLPEYGFTLSEFAVWYTLCDQRQR